MDELMEFARARRLKVIEDCAHTAGGKYQGRSLGTWGDIGCFSFEEKKCLTTGDGGMLCSDDAELIAPVRHARWVGINKDTWQREKEHHVDASINHWYYEIDAVGYKYNMNDLMASIGVVQLRRLPEMNRRRIEIILQYLEALGDSKSIRPALPYRAEQESYWAFIVRTARRDALLQHLKALDIATGVHYMPLTLHPVFARFASDTPTAMRIWPELVTLPLHASLTEEEVAYVLEGLKSFERNRT